ncbi:MAG: peptidase M14 [Acidobacteria bacterium]|nr:peptidase M14 [Acidobacteriota bacterium]
MNRKLALLVLLLLLPSGGAARAQERFEFYPGANYDPAVPTLASVLGYEIGQKLTTLANVEKFLQALEKASPRIRLARYGESYEGNPLLVAIISSPENLKSLPAIQAQTRKLADPRQTSARDADALAARTPATLWLGYGVHGNEASGTEAALLLAHHLVAGSDHDTQKILKECVVVLVPMQNPDGRARFVAAYSGITGIDPNEDAHAAEHEEPWPGGRGNHYFFDLNRDWFFLTQPEVRAQVRLYQDFLPQVFVDIHEMGTNGTYYFAPPAKPVNKNLPQQTYQWWSLYGRSIASAFDRFGFEYFTRENYDEFYPGYGGGWPLYRGATGMTFEQAAPQGIRIRRDDGVVVTMRDAAWHHFIATVAVCQTTADNREKRLRDFYDFHRSAIEEGKKEPIKAYIFTAERDRWQAEKLVRNLLWQGIEVHRTTSEQKLELRDYFSEKPSSVKLAPGAFVVPLSQPSKRLIKAIFEKEAELDPDFIREELRRFERKEPTQVYDITAWSVPLFYGMEMYWSAKIPDKLDRVTAAPQSPGRVIGGRAAYAYLMPYRGNAEARALADLLKNNHRVQVSRLPFKTDGRQFGRGTLILKVAGNPADLREKVEELARRTGADIYATGTGWVEDGASLGSSTVGYVRPPRIALLMDQEVSAASYGWLGYLLEREFAYPYTAIRLRSFSKVRLSDYDVIVLPDGDSKGYLKLLDKEAVEKLKAWVHAGGVLVGIKGAALFAADRQVALTTAVVEARREEVPEGPAARPEGEKEPEETGPQPGEEKKDPEGKERPLRISGAVLMTRVDDRTFLTMGYAENLPVLVASNIVLSPSRQGNNALLYESADRLRVSGFVWPESRGQFAGKAYLIDETIGSGHVILFADDPNFRASLDSLNRLMLNALFFAPSQRTYLQQAREP